MKVLITGANGFIGSYVAHFLMNRGYEVVATARQFHDSTKELLSAAELIPLNVLDDDQLNHLSLHADIIIHAATANDIVSRNTIDGINLSVMGTKNILDFAVRNKIGRCMVFSTLQVYGTELVGTIDEESPLNVQNDYGLNHLYAEMYAEMFTRTNKVQCVSVRPSNVYGRILTKSFNRWNLVPGCFCKEAIKSKRITIKSSGRQMRNFISLENLSRGVEAIVQGFPDKYENYNLASSQGHTMIDVAEKTMKVYHDMFGEEIDLDIQGTDPLHTNNFTIRLDKLEKTGFSEDMNYTLESEIQELFKYLQQN